MERGKGMSDVKRRRGRPIINPKDRRIYGYRLLMTKEEFDELADLASKAKCSKSAIMRFGLNLAKLELEFKEVHHAGSENEDE